MARYCHDYYGPSATSRRQQRTVRLPRTHQPGSAGTAGTLPTFTHMPVGSVGAQLYPGDIAARYRNTARGLGRPMEKRADKTDPNSNRVRASQHPIAASFGAAVLYRGFNHWYRFPYAFLPRYRTQPASGGPLLDGRGPLAAQRRTSGVSAALQLHPAVTATGDGAFHPARSYGASWRSSQMDELGESDDRRRGGAPTVLELVRSRSAMSFTRRFRKVWLGSGLGSRCGRT